MPTKPLKAPKPAPNFTRFAKWISRAAGRPGSFALGVGVVVVWGVTGPIFHYSDTWQLVINTGTTVVTFLMVFLIQNTQNRDSEAIHVKLDELIRAVEGARNRLLDLEDCDEKELTEIRADYAKIAVQARRDVKQGKSDTGIAEMK